MAVLAKVLGQQDTVGAAATDIDMYAVAANKEAIFDLHITNRNAAAATVRVYLSTDGQAGLDPKEAIVYDVQVDMDNPKVLSNLVLDATIKYLTVRASTVNVSFSAVGLERDV